MAEKAAHITSSLQSKPSIFEVIAQGSLSELLYPSFKIIIQFITTKNPEKYSWLNKYFEEVFLGLNCFIQLHYLRTKDASFAESFYGLQRFEGDKLISTRSRYWSLFCLIGLPYLANKIEKYLTSLQNEKASTCHKVLLASWKTISLMQYLAYLTGRATSHSPLLSVANLNLQYCVEQPQVSTTWADCFSNPRSCTRMISNGLTKGLELGAFFLQCLQWWHSDESSSKLASAFIPPPPTMKSVIEESMSAICPICHQRCRIETALSTSGYVFCFRCIREVVLTDHKCPVTGLPTTLDQLVRLYPTTDT